MMSIAVDDDVRGGRHVRIRSLHNAPWRYVTMSATGGTVGHGLRSADIAEEKLAAIARVAVELRRRHGRDA